MAAFSLDEIAAVMDRRRREYRSITCRGERGNGSETACHHHGRQRETCEEEAKVRQATTPLGK